MNLLSLRFLTKKTDFIVSFSYSFEMILFIHSLSEYLWSTYYVPGIVLGMGCVAVNSTPALILSTY